LATFGKELANAIQKFDGKISSNIQTNFIQLRNQINCEFDKITEKKNQLLQQTYLIESELKENNSNQILARDLIDSCISLREIDDSISLKQFQDELDDYKNNLESYSKLNFKYEFIPANDSIGKIDEKKVKILILTKYSENFYAAVEIIYTLAMISY